MSDVTLTHLEPKNDAEYRTAFQQLLEEINRLQRAMDADQIEIERLRAQSRLIAARTDARLEQLERQLDGLQRSRSHAQRSL